MKTRYPKIDFQLCKGCGRCVVACPKSLLKIGKKLNRYGFRYVEYAGEGCVGCGSCFYICPEPEALEIFEESDGQPDESGAGKLSAKGQPSE